AHLLSWSRVAVEHQRPPPAVAVPSQDRSVTVPPRGHALMAPNGFHVPGVPAAVHTHPMTPDAVGAEFHTRSPRFAAPVVGAAVPNRSAGSHEFPATYSAGTFATDGSCNGVVTRRVASFPMTRALTATPNTKYPREAPEML